MVRKAFSITNRKRKTKTHKRNDDCSHREYILEHEGDSFGKVLGVLVSRRELVKEVKQQRRGKCLDVLTDISRAHVREENEREKKEAG